MSKTQNLIMGRKLVYQRSYHLVKRLMKAELKEDAVALMSQAQELVREMEEIDRQLREHMIGHKE